MQLFCTSHFLLCFHFIFHNPACSSFRIVSFSTFFVNCFFQWINNTFSHLSSFLRLLSYVQPFTDVRNFISVAYSLLTSLNVSVKVFNSYSRTGLLSLYRMIYFCIILNCIKYTLICLYSSSVLLFSVFNFLSNLFW